MPQSIASRFLERTIAGRDHEKQCKELVLRLKEAVSTIRFYGIRERNQAEAQLLIDMEQRGNTRRVGGTQRLQDLAVYGGKLEALVEHWEADVLDRCNTLDTILSEQASPSHFHDSFLELARCLVREVTQADWLAEPPHPAPWASIPTFFSSEIVETAKLSNAQTSRKKVLTVEELMCWDGVPPRVQLLEASEAPSPCPIAAAAMATSMDDPPLLLASLQLDSSSLADTAKVRAPVSAAGSFAPAASAIIAAPPPLTFPAAAEPEAPNHSATRLNISCVCADDSEPVVTTIYVGTERGLIFSVPIECLFPQTNEECAKFASRQVQTALRAVLQKRARMDEAAVGLGNGCASSRGGDMSSASASQSATHAAGRGSQHATPSADLGASNGFYLQEGPVKVFAGHVYRVNSLRIVSHGERGRLLVSTSADKTIRWFNAATGALVGLVGPERAVCDGAIGYIRSADRMLSGHYDGTLKMWDVQSGELVKTLIELPKVGIHSVHVVPNPKDAAADAAGGPLPHIVLIGCRNGHVYGFRLMTLPCAHAVAEWNDEVSAEAMDIVHCYLPDGAPGSMVAVDAGLVVRGGHDKAVVKMASVASYLFTADVEGRVIKWDLDHREKLMSFRSHIDDITALVATSDGVLFTASKDGLFVVWDANDGSVLQRVGRHYHQVVGLVVGLRVQEEGLQSPAAMSPSTSVIGASPTASQNAQKKKRGKSRTPALPKPTETPFPLIPKTQRRQQPGSRECVALSCMQRDALGDDGAAPGDGSVTSMDTQGTTTKAQPFVLSVSKDDSMIVWQVHASGC